MTDTTELDDLESLLSHEGWLRVFRQYQQQWGATGERYLQAINDVMNRIDDVEQRRGLERIRYAQKVMAEFVTWPMERVRQLKAMQNQPTTRAEMNRQLAAQDRTMAGTPRRGGL